ncbi:MAG: hypothetical protein FD176_2914 [Rhodospirillaceae bacterium]|nr:MAG: hypothetical protein FD176_2914 [Rhodospirillaceae bacterium]TNC95311.1 MAG: hypothetical protein FD119_2435 [Stygiobacter sp.]
MIVDLDVGGMNQMHGESVCVDGRGVKGKGCLCANRDVDDRFAPMGAVPEFNGGARKQTWRNPKLRREFGMGKWTLTPFSLTPFSHPVFPPRFPTPFSHPVFPLTTPFSL